MFPITDYGCEKKEEEEVTEAFASRWEEFPELWGSAGRNKSPAWEFIISTTPVFEKRKGEGGCCVSTTS